MNKQKGDMYPFVTHTMNFVRGECPHDCVYCYMKGLIRNLTLRLESKEFRTDLGSGNFIFVGSSIDVFAEVIPTVWIKKVLEYCKNFNNRYLFQSKNPKRFCEFGFPKDSVLGTTIETNRDYKLSKAPSSEERYKAMLNAKRIFNFPIMISIEPMMDFDLEFLTIWIKELKPEFVSVGADSKRHNLPEPSREKIEKLIEELRKFTEIKIKSNLKRLYE